MYIHWTDSAVCTWYGNKRETRTTQNIFTLTTHETSRGSRQVKVSGATRSSNGSFMLTALCEALTTSTQRYIVELRGIGGRIAVLAGTISGRVSGAGHLASGPSRYKLLLVVHGSTVLGHCWTGRPLCFLGAVNAVGAPLSQAQSQT